MDADEQRWDEFVKRHELSTLTGTPPETEIQAEATELYRAGNRFALKMVVEANRHGGSGTLGNPIHDLARIYFMYSADSPGQNVPASMDESGLWRKGNQ
jgi:hypothetical protein